MYTNLQYNVKIVNLSLSLVKINAYFSNQLKVVLIFLNALTIQPSFIKNHVRVEKLHLDKHVNAVHTSSLMENQPQIQIFALVFTHLTVKH